MAAREAVMPDFTVIRYGTDSSGRPIYMTRYMQSWLDHLLAACQAFRDPFVPTIVQGAFMARAGGGAAASAGYHDAGGCLDFRVWNLTAEQIGFLVRECRRTGAAAWHRDESHGGMDPHCHITLGSDRPLSSGAAASWASYLRDENGLTGGSAGRDYHWRPDPLVTTWEPPRSVPVSAENVSTIQEEDMPYKDWPQADKDALAHDVAEAVIGRRLPHQTDAPKGRYVGATLTGIYNMVREIRDSLRGQTAGK